jgi:hypothetical protein
MPAIAVKPTTAGTQGTLEKVAEYNSKAGWKAAIAEILVIEGNPGKNLQQ